MKKQRAVHPSEHIPQILHAPAHVTMLPLPKRVIEHLYVVSIPGRPLNSERGCWILWYAFCRSTCWLLFFDMHFADRLWTPPHLICILQIDSADYAIFDLHVADRFADFAVLIGILQIDSADCAFSNRFLPSRSIVIFDTNATPS